MGHFPATATCQRLSKDTFRDRTVNVTKCASDDQQARLKLLPSRPPPLLADGHVQAAMTSSPRFLVFLPNGTNSAQKPATRVCVPGGGRARPGT